MKQELVQLAKDKGFHISLGEIHLPLGQGSSEREIMWMSLLQKWLREVHDIQIEIISFYQDNIVFGYNYCMYKTQIERIEYELNELSKPIHCDYNIYEEALEEGLTQSLKLIKL